VDHPSAQSMLAVQQVCTPAEDEALVHVVAVQHALQQPLLQHLDSLATALRGGHVGTYCITNMHVVCVGLRVGVGVGAKECRGTRVRILAWAAVCAAVCTQGWTRWDLLHHQHACCPCRSVCGVGERGGGWAEKAVSVRFAAWAVV
jgi:hypothetical protein